MKSPIVWSPRLSPDRTRNTHSRVRKCFHFESEKEDTRQKRFLLDTFFTADTIAPESYTLDSWSWQGAHASRTIVNTQYNSSSLTLEPLRTISKAKATTYHRFDFSSSLFFLGRDALGVEIEKNALDGCPPL